MSKVKTILCIGGRCSTWGRSWRKHLYSGSENCLRCGMSRREQFEEDKLEGTAWGEYEPAPPAKQSKIVRNPQQIQYCAIGDYGIEFVANTKKEVQKWINEEIAGTGLSDEPVDPEYYAITTFTKAELAEMPEV